MKASFFAGAQPARSARYAPFAGEPRSGAEATGPTLVADIPETQLVREQPVDAALCPRESARIAIYDAAGAAPRVEEVAPHEAGEYIALLATRTYELARALGGRVPFSVISEVVENFIHAEFRAPVVTILDAGNTIRFSDQGPGIRDKVRALEPGYTTASQRMKAYIRGVGSGLPLARECMAFSEGTILVDDNLDAGAVITVSVPAQTSDRSEARALSRRSHEWTAAGVDPILPFADPAPEYAPGPAPNTSAFLGAPRLSNRQKRVLALVMEASAAGPSLVARELAIGLSTAYRDLAHLEALGYITADESGKRSLTEEGTGYLKTLLDPGA